MMRLYVALLLFRITFTGDLTDRITEDDEGECLGQDNAHVGAKVLAQAIEQVEADDYRQLYEYFTSREVVEHHEKRKRHRQDQLPFFDFIGKTSFPLKALGKELEKQPQSDVIIGKNILIWMDQLRAPLFDDKHYHRDHIWNEEAGVFKKSERFQNSLCRLGVNLMRVEFFGRMYQKCINMLDDRDPAQRALKMLRMIDRLDFIKSFIPELLNNPEQMVGKPKDQKSSLDNMMQKNGGGGAVEHMAARNFIRTSLTTMSTIIITLRFQHCTTTTEAQSIPSPEAEAYRYAADAISTWQSTPNAWDTVFDRLLVTYRQRCLNTDRNTEPNAAKLKTLYIFLSTDRSATDAALDALTQQALIDCGTLFRALWVAGTRMLLQFQREEKPLPSKTPESPTESFLRLIFPGPRQIQSIHRKNFLALMKLLHDMARLSDQDETIHERAKSIAGELCVDNRMRLNEQFLISVIETYDVPTVEAKFPDTAAGAGGHAGGAGAAAAAHP